MLKQISVSNLGCFGDRMYTVDFSEETLLAGPNNSGKSMLLAGMNFLRYYFIASHSWNTPYYRLSNFDAAVNAHDPKKIVRISMSLTKATERYDFHLAMDRNRGPFDLMVNKQKVSARDPRFVNLLKKIWFFSPNRSLVPY